MMLVHLLKTGKNEQKTQKHPGRALIFRSMVGHLSDSAGKRNSEHINSGAMSAKSKIQQAVCRLCSGIPIVISK